MRKLQGGKLYRSGKVSMLETGINKDLIGKAIDAFDCDEMFSVRCINDQVLLFNEIFLRIHDQLYLK